MNPKTLVKISNTIGVISIILLIYWVFSFISIQVFGFKVFRENITESFYFSIIGILALMTGALIINLMFNLTRIAEKHNDDKSLEKKISKKVLIIFLLSFPVIFGVLFTGDYLTSQKKEKMLINSANRIIKENSDKADKIADYNFDNNWINKTSDILKFFSSIDKNFPRVQVIVQDKMDGTKIYLGVQPYSHIINDTVQPKKINYIQKTTQEERDYLQNVFEQKTIKTRFSASDGNYELFYPYIKNGKLVVFYFTDYQKYGKFGS
jgi:NADH:ubiquinone oxidoreductase subunit 5 (subunit L)/multisubunit Na+/H+ antiporter MnhA subunit